MDARPLAFEAAAHRLRPAGLAFRPIGETDRGFLEALFVSIRSDEFAVLPWSQAQRERFLCEQFALQDLHYRRNYPDASYLLIILDGAPVGRLYLHRSASELRLVEVSLIAGRRGRGLGSALLGELIEESEWRNLPIGLHVEPHNPAARLYARHGFVLIEDAGIYQYLRRDPRRISSG